MIITKKKYIFFFTVEDGRICILPVGKYIQGWTDGQDRRFPINDVVMHQANGSRARPTAIVW